MKFRKVASTLQPNQLAKKIRSCLLAQKKRLEEYMFLLDKEEEDILKEDPDRLIAHIELEKDIISELASLKKILDPLEIMYFNSPYKKDSRLIDVKKNINVLSDQIVERSNKNREELETIIVKIKLNLRGITKTGITKAAYKKVEATLVDVSG